MWADSVMPKPDQHCSPGELALKNSHRLREACSIVASLWARLGRRPTGKEALAFAREVEFVDFVSLRTALGSSFACVDWGPR